MTAPTDSASPTIDGAVAAALAALDAAVAAKPGGEQRAGQHEMCAAVARALATGEHLLVEAPTGIGKSIAYAIAAVLHVHARAAAQDAEYAASAGGDDDEPERPRVVIATATKALQEQLCDEDLPALARVLADLGAPFEFALLKGRSNYVCPAKLDELEAGEEPETLLAPTKREVARGEQIARVVTWAATTDTGDRAELDEDVPDEVWQALSTTARDCPGTNTCPAGPRCLAEKARARARDADVVVVNTSLYAADVAAGGFVLPPHDTVIVDEAHLLEDIVADAFGADVHGGRLRALAAELAHFRGDADLVNRLRTHAQRLDVLLEQLAGARDPRVRACEGELAEVLSAIRVSVTEASTALRDTGGVADDLTRASRRSRASKSAGVLEVELGMLLDPDAYETHVAWCELMATGDGKRARRPRLILVPVEVDTLLADRLFPHATVVATSATLAIGGALDTTAARFGLTNAASERPAPAWEGLRVPSPFDFREQAVLYVPKHLPDPRTDAYAPAMAEELHSLISAAGGRTLALFTSWTAMKTAADACAAHGTYEVLRQGDAPRGKLLDRLKESAQAGGVAVFATMSFWTGVDVAGLGLTLVAIDRIPFPRPNDPLQAARRDRAEERGRSGFQTVDLPRAAIQLAQGAGRLVRARTDRGVVAVLDRRLAVAGYRSFLLAGLPAFRRSIDPDAVRALLAELAVGAASPE